jgi:hypothetical protein
MPEITDPRIDVVVVEEADRLAMEEQGYTLVKRLLNDHKDPALRGQYLILMVNPEAPNTRLISGALSNTSNKRRGQIALTDMGNHKSKPVYALKEFYSVNRINAKEIEAYGKNPNSYDPGSLTPKMNMLVNGDGEPSAYRYLMTRYDKDTLLNPDNDFSLLLGTMAAKTFDKVASKENNQQIVDAAKKQFDEEYKLRPQSFAFISADSAEEEYRKMWNTIPYDTRQYIKEVFGEDGIYLRRDMLDIIMGYHRLSAANVFLSNPAHRTFTEKMVTNMVSYWFSQNDVKAAAWVSKAEAISIEVVSLTKDIIVNRTGTVLLGNVISNMSLLALNRVPITDILKYHVEGFTAFKEYRKDKHRLNKINQKLLTNPVNKAALEKERYAIMKAMTTSHIHKLVEEGLMPTIQEDVDYEFNKYSYSNGLLEMMKPKYEKLPTLAQDIFENLFMTPSTTEYGFFSQLTQMSDFIARYTMYQYETQKRSNKLTHQEAIEKASRAFINYDVPAHRAMEYMNATGIVWFTRYYMRIQSYLMQNMRDNPSRLLLMGLLDNYFNMSNNILDSGWWQQMGNPFNNGYGPSRLLSSFDNILPLNTLMDLFGAITPN